MIARTYQSAGDVEDDQRTADEAEVELEVVWDMEMEVEYEAESRGGMSGKVNTPL